VPDTTQDLAAPPEPLQGIFGLDLGRMKAALGYGQSFDIAVREFRVGNRNAALIMVDGFSHDLLVQQVMISLMRAEQGDPASSLEMILARDLVFAKINPVGTIKEAVGQVLMGRTVLLVDGALDAVAIDMRTYPGRNPEEPDLERVIRGSRDGFVETVMFNVALIRRRLRDPRLRFELQPVGRRSQTDVVVAYLQDVADPALVQEVRSRLRKVDVDGLPMAEKSLEEFILEQRKWWNPYPTIRYTERPDVTAVHLLEGHVAILVDTSPSVMLLPVTIFHHIQHAEEYRQDVLVGAYLRWVRTFGIFISAFITPVWILLAHYPELMPALQGVIGTKGQFAVPVWLQFFLAEILLDIFRMALVHTPTALSTSLGIIGAILLGQMAIDVGLLAAETVMYVALAAIGTFATPSMEFAMAVRLFRLLYLLGVVVLGPVGFFLVLIVNLLLLLVTRSFGVPYTWPLIPLDVSALTNVLVRRPVPVHRMRPRMLRPLDPDRIPDEGKSEKQGGIARPTPKRPAPIRQWRRPRRGERPDDDGMN
jgi:stage V sporulation protein AF